MNVVLHIGAPKTGSSAIQYFLHANRERLQKHGFYYPAHNFDENFVSGGHANFGAAVANNEMDKAQQLLQEWRQQAEQKDCTLLLSSEALYRCPKRVKKLLEGFDARILGSFRHPLESLVSNHNQSIKRHYSSLTLDDFLFKQVGISNRGVSGQVFYEWRKHFSAEQVSVRPYYQPGFFKAAIELDFLQRLGIEGWSARRFKRSKARINTSYTQGALEIKRLLNGLLDQQQPKESRLIDRALQAYSDQHNNSRNWQPQVVSDGVYEAITARYQPAMEKAQRELLENCPAGFLSPRTVQPITYSQTRFDLIGVVDAYKTLCRQLPELMEELQARLLQKLTSQRSQDDAESLPYALLKLAEVMGLPVPEPKIEQPLPATAMDTFLSEKANRVDYLREIARWLERHDQTESAVKVLAHGYALAEQEGIRGERMKALQRQLASYQERLATLAAQRKADDEAIIGDSSDPD